MEDVRVVGCVEVAPPLNRAEYEYLTAFAESRRWRRPAGPYAVPDNPVAECTDTALDLEAYTTPAFGQPGLGCPWLPARAGSALITATPPTGAAIVVDEVAAWLTYLVNHFLGSAGEARTRPDFAGFTFDHVLEGAAAAYRVDTGALTVVRVGANAVRVERAFAGLDPGADRPLVA